MKLHQKFLWAIQIVTMYFLLSGVSVWASGSSLQYLGDLYRSGRPQTGEFGEVRDIASWRSYLYVSWSDLDGDYWLDAWRLDEGGTASAIESVYFGNSSDDAGALIPVAHLKSPRDLAIVDGHLVLWSLFELRSYPLRFNGTLGEPSVFAPQDRDNGVNRIKVFGNYASTSKRRLSEQEVNALIANGMPLNQIEPLLTGIGLINLQNPVSPFISSATQSLGANLFLLPSDPVGVLRGLPVTATLSDDNLRVTVTELSQARPVHYSSFWEGKVRKILRAKSLSRSLQTIAGRIVSRRTLRAELPVLLAQLQRGGRVNQSRTLAATIRSKFSEVQDLESAFADYGISASDSLAVAVQKVVAQELRRSAVVGASRSLVKSLATQWVAELFSLNDTPIQRMKAQVEAVMASELKSQGLSRYLVKTVLAPLVDIPSELLLSLGELINLISSSDVAQAIDAFLGTYHSTFPVEGLLNLVGFDPPQCFEIPQSAKGLLELLLLESGPQLDRQELALFELLKLVQYYLGNTQTREFVTSLRTAVENLHEELSSEFVDAVVRPLTGVAGATGKFSKVLQSVFGKVEIEPLIVRVLSRPVLRAFEARSIDTAVSLEALFQTRAAAGKGSELRFARVGDLLDLLVEVRLANTTVGKVYELAGRLGLPVISADLRSFVLDSFEEIFGALPPTSTLTQAVSSLIANEMSPHLLGEFVEGILGRVLSERKMGTSFPDLIGILGLKGQGDCVSQWRTALNAAQATAVLLQLDPLALALFDVELALSQAVDSAISFLLRELVQEFIDGVFDVKAQSYPSWVTAVEATTRTIDLAAAGVATTRFGTAAAYGDRLAVILRNAGVSLPTPELGEAVTVVRFDPQNAAGTLSLTDVGNFSLVNSIQSSGRYVLVVGNFSDGSFFGSANATLIDIGGESLQVRRLSGDRAADLSAASRIAVLGDGARIAVLSGGGYVSILQ